MAAPTGEGRFKSPVGAADGRAVGETLDERMSRIFTNTQTHHNGVPTTVHVEAGCVSIRVQGDERIELFSVPSESHEAIAAMAEGGVGRMLFTLPATGTSGLSGSLRERELPRPELAQRQELDAIWSRSRV